MKKKCLITFVLLLAALLSCQNLFADINLGRNGDWSASNAGSDPNGHGTSWDGGTVAWTYYTKWVEPFDATVYPGPDYSPGELVKMPFRQDKAGFYDPFETTNSHIIWEYETMGLIDRLYVYWNSISSQTGGSAPPYEPLAPYGKQQWCVAIFTNNFGFDISVDISGASEIQTAQKGYLDGTKAEIAKINAAFDSKTPLWSYEFAAGPYLDGNAYPWNNGWVTSHIFGDFMLESALQNITLAAGESLAFGLRAGNREGEVDVFDPESQFLFTSWVDDEVVLTVSSTQALTLTIATNPAGNEGATTGAGTYSLGDTASVSASDFSDCGNNVVYKFDHWEGDVADPGSAQTTVLMGSDEAITAVYAATAECGDECHPVPAGSVDGDCDVDIDDLGDLAANWLDSSI